MSESWFNERLSEQYRLEVHQRFEADNAARVASLDVQALVEQVRFAIAGARVVDEWPPDYCVYESGFTYRLVPAVAQRVLVQARARAGGESRLAPLPRSVVHQQTLDADGVGPDIGPEVLRALLEPDHGE